MDIENIKNGNKNYIFNSFLGKGVYGSVLKCISDKNEIVALKKFDIKNITQYDNITGKNSLNDIENEINIHKNLNHNNIVKFIDSFKSNLYIYIIMDICDCSLYDCIYSENPKNFNKDEILKIIKEISEGIKYLHSLLIVHCDIKLKNILLDSNCTIKICDFGYSRKLENIDDYVSDFRGTVDYYAPEMIGGMTCYSFPIDIWAFGVVIYEIIFKILPFKSKNKKETFIKIKICEYKIPIECDNFFVLIISKMLELDPTKRIMPNI